MPNSGLETGPNSTTFREIRSFKYRVLRKKLSKPLRIHGRTKRTFTLSQQEPFVMVGAALLIDLPTDSLPDSCLGDPNTRVTVD
jgi:hypothetical protein